MKKHLNPDELTGYIYRTLDDTRRESIDAHLLHCPTCRASLTQQELWQRQISHEMSAELKAATPSEQMTFAAIAPLVQTRPTGLNLWPSLATFAPVSIALIGLLFAFLGLWQVIDMQAITIPIRPLGAFPTLASFALVLASVQQFDHTFSLQPRLAITWLVAAILWLGSAIIGLLDMIVIRDLAIMAVIALEGGRAQAGPIAIMAVMFGAMLYIGLVIGGAEYHYKNIGQPGSWKFFSITLLLQSFILILPYLLL